MAGVQPSTSRPSSTPASSSSGGVAGDFRSVPDSARTTTARSQSGSAAEERDRSRFVSSGAASTFRSPAPASPLQPGMQTPGVGGVGLRSGSQTRPDAFTNDQAHALKTTIDQRSGGNPSKVSDLGRRSIDGMTKADPYNLRFNYDAKSGRISIDRQHIYGDRTEWRQVWKGREPQGAGNTSQAWSKTTQQAGNALINDYSARPYNNQPPPANGAFFRGAIDNINGKPGNYREWGIPPGNRRT